MSRLTRGRTVLACLLAGALLLLAAGRTWLEVDLGGMLAGAGASSVSGNDAAPLVSALALVGLAGAAAVSLAGRVGRTVAGVLVVLAGLGGIAGSVAVLVSPVPAATSAVAEQTMGAALTAEQVSVTGWPAAAAVLAALLAVTGVVVLVAGRRWESGRRFESASPDRADSPARREPVADWDALSRGDDPTAEDPAGEGPTGDDPPDAGPRRG